MDANIIQFLCVIIIGYVELGDANTSGFVVDINTNGSFRLLVNDQPWLVSGKVFFNSQGKRYSDSDGSLKMANTTLTGGNDKVGQWQAIQYTYFAGTLPVMTSLKTYTNPDLPLVIFSQKYLGTATGTSAQDPQYLISGYPTFKTSKVSDVHLGYLGYGGDMSGYSDLNIGRWGPTSYFTTGIGGGPLVIYDNSSNAMVISPLSQFMAASSHVPLLQQELSYGIMGLVDTVPINYSVDFIVYYSDRGINQAIREWGEFLRTVYNKSLQRRNVGITLNYMGYWTDNGAYFYYNTEKGKNYEATILDTVNYINSHKIPFKYIQYDSWWYPKGHRHGTVTWTPMKDVLPDGFRYLSDQTKLPFACHNRYWDAQTTYAKYNGGQYNFIQDKIFGLAVPDDDRFWFDLFNMTKQWGDFIMYEQDWLNWETDQNRVLLSDLFLGRRWLLGMGNGAGAYANIDIQYCMAYSRHILQSLEIPAVTQARVSQDYSPGGKQWNIGITSMFADAVGLAPYKDTFWTTTVQPGSPYHSKKELYTRLNAAIATLSTGPVGPGDGIGYINMSLLMRCCDSEGKILQPNKPATAIDDQIKKQAFPSISGPTGEVYTTYSNISGQIFGIVLVADLSNIYSLTPSSGWTPGMLPPSVIYCGNDPDKKSTIFSDDEPLELNQVCTTENFCMYYTSPLLHLASGNSLVLLGESDKWVPMSNKRFSSIQQTANDVLLHLNVNARETVTFDFLTNNGPVQTVTCDNSQSKRPATQSTISIVSKSCFLK